MSGLIIGVDGGGSKTSVIVATGRGEEIATSEGAGSAVTPGNAARSADAIAAAVRDALATADRVDEAPRMIYVGVAGVGRHEEKRALQEELDARELAEEVIVDSDVSIAMTDAFGTGPGVILIAGTGSIAYGRSPSGALARCGGWGLAIGDEGGGAWIGRRALGIVAASSDGREPPTELTGAILTATQVNEVEELIPWSIAASPASCAALAPVVFTAAANGDVRAAALVSLAVEELALHVRALARQLFADERAAVPVALSGGLLQKGSFLRKRLEHRLRAAVPGASVHAGNVVAARGAVRAAAALVSV